MLRERPKARFITVLMTGALMMLITAGGGCGKKEKEAEMPKPTPEQVQSGQAPAAAPVAAPMQATQ